MSWEELQRINKAIENAKAGLDKFGNKSPQGLAFNAELKALKAQKANLPPETLRRERVEKLTKQLIRAVYRDMLGASSDMQTYVDQLKSNDVHDEEIQQIITTTRQDYHGQAQTIILEQLQQKLEESLIAYYESTGKPLQLNVQSVLDGATTIPAIQAIIKRATNLSLDAQTIQSQVDEVLFLTETETKQKLSDLTTAVQKYVADAAFMAELDPSYHVPKDMVIEIQIWEANEDEIQPSEAQRKIMRTKRDLEIRSVSKDIIQQAIYAGQNNT